MNSLEPAKPTIDLRIEFVTLLDLYKTYGEHTVELLIELTKDLTKHGERLRFTQTVGNEVISQKIFKGEQDIRDYFNIK